MKTPRSILMVCLIGILVLTACAQQQTGQTLILPVQTAQVTAAVLEPTILPTAGVGVSSTAEVSQATQDSPTAMAATDTPANGQKNVTIDDRGKTITMNVGESFLLNLGEIYNWDVSVSDQNVLSRVKNIAVIRGAQGVYLAHQPGTITLSATGDPACRQSKPACAMPSLLFTVTVVVK